MKLEESESNGHRRRKSKSNDTHAVAADPTSGTHHSKNEKIHKKRKKDSLSSNGKQPREEEEKCSNQNSKENLKSQLKEYEKFSTSLELKDSGAVKRAKSISANITDGQAEKFADELSSDCEVRVLHENQSENVGSDSVNRPPEMNSLHVNVITNKVQDGDDQTKKKCMEPLSSSSSNKSKAVQNSPVSTTCTTDLEKVCSRKKKKSKRTDDEDKNVDGALKGIANHTNNEETLTRVSSSPESILVNSSRKKLLVLDMNGLLVDMVNIPSKERAPDIQISLKSVYKRPFCDDFLKFCFENFDVGIWSSRERKNLMALVKFLLRDYEDKVLFIWDQSHCTNTGYTTVEKSSKPLFLKELKRIWDKEESSLPWEKGYYNPSNTLLLDDSPYKALLNPPYTAIFPMPYSFKDKNDHSLGLGGKLRVYLEGVAASDDIQQYVQEHQFGQRAITNKNPSWGYYEKIISSLKKAMSPQS